jgi:hypothetical protein
MLERARIRGAEDLLAEVVAGRADLAAFSDGAALDTDDDPRIELDAPRTRFLPASTAEAIFAKLAGPARDVVASFVDLAPQERVALCDAAAGTGNWAAAEAWARALGDGADAHARIGDLRWRQGDENGALLEWNEALRRDPTNQPAINGLARVRGRLGG